MEYIFFPVNDNELVDKSEGSHWSLLVYSKNDHTWYHLDSQRGLNNKHARCLMTKVNAIMDGETPPKFVVTNCTQQDNGYDCGTFTMLHAQEMAKKAVEKLHLDTCEVSTLEASKMRIIIRDLILVEKHMAQNKRNRTKETNQMESEQICHYWRKYRCKKGNKCLFNHPKLCESHIKTGECREVKKTCGNYHPIICRNNLRNEKCNYGDRCKFRHINREDNRENLSNYYVSEDRNRNWQNRNRGKERYNEGNLMYSESHNQIGQQYNDWSNGENYWYKDDYSNSDRYENENTIHQTF
ncbi:unnamed protein product [Meganyctiphanes norvegica]|uniref:Uncharacterized protein n=1 Tax=Meganyctiphanes norvegica TaxID=48144 RepID=A0AAV2SRX9_MEGNR